MRPADVISHGIRRIAQMRYFSRSPLAGSPLLVRRRRADVEFDTRIDEAVALSVRAWTVFQDTWFAEFQVAPLPNSPRPEAAQVVFSSCSVEFPITRGGPTRVALPVPAAHLGERVGLAIELSDGRTVIDWQPGLRTMTADPAGLLFARFAEELRARPAGAVLEIGSRARSGTLYRAVVPPGWTYTGMDVREGPNVDVVGDAHDLTRLSMGHRFDAVFSVSVFEHLLMPWKVAVEINRVLKPGGLVYAATHQCLPLHDEPWDFWRLSDRAWAGLFNRSTGFELLDAQMGQRASVVPQAVVDATWPTRNEPAYLVSCALARKTSDATVDWPVDAAALIADAYPT